MKILTTPWKNDLLELVANAKHSIKITSPFVKEEICREIIDAKQTESDFELITSFKLMSVYSGSLDLSALEIIISSNGIVKNFSKLQKGQKNTIIRQLYYPFRQWQHHTTKQVKTIFFDKIGDVYRIWQFEFRNPNDYNSIEIVKAQSFHIRENF